MSDGDYGALVALYMGFIAFLIVAVLVAYIVSSFFMMKLFEKAGVQGGWRAWVPVYNMMVFFKLGDLSPWLVLYGVGGTLLLSWIGIGYLFSLALGVFSAIAAYRIGLKLQKEGAWVVLYVFLSLVWLGIVAFDKSRWNQNVPPAPWAGNAFLGDNTVWDGVPTQTSAGTQAYGQAGYGQAGYGQAGYGQPGYPAQPAQPYQQAGQPYQQPGQPSYPAQPPSGAPVPPPAPGATTPPAAPPAPPAAPRTDADGQPPSGSVPPAPPQP